ncbi:MAG: hypothetical protein JNL72_00345 [Flavipsychrobacter sp.]|nr:hypothetical protein [Flavipsychrobacter sp.]
MKKITVIALLSAAFASCSSNKNKLQQLSWLIGTWEMSMLEGTFREQWQKTNDTLYSGTGMMLSTSGDTLFSERIELVQIGDRVYYKPVVSDQNNGQVTVFTESSLNAEQAVFSNPSHDFPQNITYRRTSDSTFQAQIDGVQQGKSRQEQFRFTRRR